MSIVKYTPEVIKSKLNAMVNMLDNNAEIVFINQLTTAVNMSASSYKRLATNDKLDAETRAIIKSINDKLEQRLVLGGLTNKLNTALVIFILKNKYQYTDKQQVDNTHRIQPILSGMSNATADAPDAPAAQLLDGPAGDAAK